MGMPGVKKVGMGPDRIGVQAHLVLNLIKIYAPGQAVVSSAAKKE